MSDSQLQIQAVRMLSLAPMFAVMLVGMILAIRKLPAYPRPCWSILAAIVLSAFNNVGLPYLMGWIMEMTGGFASTSDLLVRNFLWMLPHALLGAISWGLIFFAVFDRPDPPKFLHEDDFANDTPGR